MTRRRRDSIKDGDSPDFSTCEHCGEAIGWDDYSYTHMSNGFAECGLVVSDGRAPRSLLERAVVGWAAVRGSRVSLDPVVTQDQTRTTRAEPVEWFEDVDPRSAP